MSTFKNIQSLKALNKYLSRYRKLLIWGTIFVIISNFFAVISAKVVGSAFDSLIESLKNHEDVSAQILKYSLLIIGAAIMTGLFMFLMRQTIIVMSRKVEYDLKNDIYAHFQHLSLGYYRRHNTGDLMARISEDVGRVRMYIGPAIMYGINLFSRIILTVIIMLSVNIKLTFFALLPLPFLAVAIYFVNNITYNKGMAIQQQLSRLTTFVQEVFSGIRVVKTFASEESLKMHFEKEVDVYRAKSLGLVRVDSFFFPAIIFLIGLSTLITMYEGSILAIHQQITPGVIPQFLMYVIQLGWPVASLGFTTSLIQRAAASQSRINELLNARPEIIYDNGKSIVLKGDIRFQNVSFVYPDTGIKALSNINIQLPAGKSLGILGRTGSGKSTLANLILRSYDTTAGNILIDGMDIRELDLGNYRRQIGYVPQDDFLFSESIADNILFGYSKPVNVDSEEIKEQMNEQVMKSATTADIFKDVIGFPDGFDTMIGERGITLSGGQKQRVGIARAIVNDPHVLILDDCFSAIDTNTEAKILQNLSEVMRGKTSVIVSHRVSTVKNASHIIVLDAGTIVEEGNHEQLMQRHGYYYTLYRKQLMEKELYDKQKDTI
jgi:ATP-binding cassette, subfamily B, multidrug efflux pump